MKKIIFASAMMLTIGLTSAFANRNDEINAQVTSSFNRDFSSAKQVQWRKDRNFIKATFTLDSQIMCAYYKENGELLGVVRNILSDKLPINLISNLKKNYNDYWISDLFELASDGQSSYYITLESPDETIVLKSEGTSEWSVYKKAKKE